jgi:hypothetical protein
VSTRQEEDDAARLAMGMAWASEHHPEWAKEPENPEFAEYARDIIGAMLDAFDAGMKRGEGKRGCCHEHDPETVAVGIVREAEDKRDG